VSILAQIGFKLQSTLGSCAILCLECSDVISEPRIRLIFTLTVLLFLDLFLHLCVVFQIGEQIMDLLVVDFQVAHSHVVLHVSLLFIHLVE
jgi:hypothetical protein